MKRILWQSDGAAVLACLHDVTEGDELVVDSERRGDLVRIALKKIRPGVTAQITVDATVCDEEARKHRPPLRIMDYVGLPTNARQMTEASRGEVKWLQERVREMARNHPVPALLQTVTGRFAPPMPEIQETPYSSDRAPLELELNFAELERRVLQQIASGPEVGERTAIFLQKAREAGAEVARLDLEGELFSLQEHLDGGGGFVRVPMEPLPAHLREYFDDKGLQSGRLPCDRPNYNNSPRSEDDEKQKKE